MWSRGRIIRVVLYVVILAFLIWYGQENDPSITLDMCVTHPKKYDGVSLTIGNEAKVYSVRKNGFVIQQMNHRIPVRGNVENLTPGARVTITAIFHQKGWLELRDIHIIKHREAKIWLSIIPVILIVFFFFRCFRFNVKKIQFERRRCLT